MDRASTARIRAAGSVVDEGADAPSQGGESPTESPSQYSQVSLPEETARTTESGRLRMLSVSSSSATPGVPADTPSTVSGGPQANPLLDPSILTAPLQHSAGPQAESEGHGATTAPDITVIPAGQVPSDVESTSSGPIPRSPSGSVYTRLLSEATLENINFPLGPNLERQADLPQERPFRQRLRKFLRRQPRPRPADPEDNTGVNAFTPFTRLRRAIRAAFRGLGRRRAPAPGAENPTVVGQAGPASPGPSHHGRHARQLGTTLLAKVRAAWPPARPAEVRGIGSLGQPSTVHLTPVQHTNIPQPLNLTHSAQRTTSTSRSDTVRFFTSEHKNTAGSSHVTRGAPSQATSRAAQAAAVPFAAEDTNIAGSSNATHFTPTRPSPTGSASAPAANTPTVAGQPGPAPIQDTSHAGQLDVSPLTPVQDADNSRTPNPGQVQYTGHIAQPPATIHSTPVRDMNVSGAANLTRPTSAASSHSEDLPIATTPHWKPAFELIPEDSDIAGPSHAIQSGPTRRGRRARGRASESQRVPIQQAPTDPVPTQGTSHAEQQEDIAPTAVQDVNIARTSHSIHPGPTQGVSHAGEAEAVPPTVVQDVNITRTSHSAQSAQVPDTSHVGQPTTTHHTPAQMMNLAMPLNLAPAQGSSNTRQSGVPRSSVSEDVNIAGPSNATHPTPEQRSSHAGQPATPRFSASEGMNITGASRPIHLTRVQSTSHAGQPAAPRSTISEDMDIARPTHVNEPTPAQSTTPTGPSQATCPTPEQYTNRAGQPAVSFGPSNVAQPTPEQYIGRAGRPIPQSMSSDVNISELSHVSQPTSAQSINHTGRPALQSMFSNMDIISELSHVTQPTSAQSTSHSGQPATTHSSMAHDTNTAGPSHATRPVPDPRIYHIRPAATHVNTSQDMNGAGQHIEFRPMTWQAFVPDRWYIIHTQFVVHVPVPQGNIYRMPRPVHSSATVMQIFGPCFFDAGPTPTQTTMVLQMNPFSNMDEVELRMTMMLLLPEHGFYGAQDFDFTAHRNLRRRT